MRTREPRAADLMTVAQFTLYKELICSHFSGMGACGDCGLNTKHNGVNQCCEDYVISHPEKAAETLADWVNKNPDDVRDEMEEEIMRLKIELEERKEGETRNDS